MRSGSPAPPPDPPATRLRSSLGLLRYRSQLEHVELGRALRPRDHQPPFERPDSLEQAGPVALEIVAVSQRLPLVAEIQAAKEDQPVGIVVLPQPPRGPLAPRLLDDRQQVAL